MRLLIGTIAATAALTLPAFAQDADVSAMTCADFTAMEAEAQMAAMDTMQMTMEAELTAAETTTDPAADAAATTEMTGEMAAADETATETTTDMATDTAEADMATETEATTEMGTDMAAADAGTEGAAAEEDPMMTALMTVCEGSPDMMVMDAMMQAQGG